MASRGVIAFGCGILYARSLGPLGRGQISLVITTAGLIGLGVHTVAVPSFVRARLSGAWSDGQLRAQALVMVLQGSMPLAVAAAVVLGVTGSDVPLDALLFLTVALSCGTSLIYVSQGVGEVARAGALGGIGAAAAGAVTVCLAVTDRLTPRTAVVAFSLVYLVPLIGLLAGGRLRWPRARSAARLQPSTTASGVLVLLLWRSDIYVVAGLLSTKELGIYAVGVSIAEVTQVTLSGLRAALTPRLRPLGSEDLPVALFARLDQLAVVLLGGVAVVLAAFGRTIFETVYGRSFSSAAAVALVLLPGMWGFITMTTYLETLQISGQGRFLMLALCSALLANVVINLSLTHRYGLLVPAASSSVCYLSLGVLTVRQASRTASVPARRLLWPQGQPS